MSAYTKAFDHYTEGLEAISAGPSPGCEDCASNWGFRCVRSFSAAYEAGEIEPEPSFSWRPCDLCGTTLGGDREEWHALIPNEDGTLKGAEMIHGNNACMDCVVSLANGDEPEEWRAS